MHRDRSLTDLIRQRRFTSIPELADRQVAALAQVVAQASKPLPKAGWDWPPFMRGVALPSSSLALATKTYSQVLEQGGNNRTRVEEELLGAMALSASPAAVPFWTSLLELKRIRDTFAKERRLIAVTALALVVFEHSDPLALAALLHATRHEVEETRAAAAEALAQAFIQAQRPAPEPVLARLSELAQDKRFEPRFVARRACAWLGKPLPPDVPHGTYSFEVKLGDCSRTVELRSTQTLDSLCSAILSAMDWDHDHLWNFFLNGKERDQTYAWPPPEEDAGSFGFLDEDEDEDEDTADDAPPINLGATAAGEPEQVEPEEFDPTLGDLGLAKGHAFLLLYDYGDHNLFRIKVVGVSPKADARAKHPRVVAQKGKAIEQYGGDFD